MYYAYIILIFLIIFILFKIYVKIKYKFWAYQPIFHYHNLLYWIYPIGIINKELPKTNKYCNFLNISTKEFSEYDKNTLKEIVAFIRTHYYRNKTASYLPILENFSSYFIGNNDFSLISTYYRSNTIMTNTSYIADKELMGIMATRPVNITLKNLSTFRANYVDYLCVHTDHRKKNIAPELIQTHEYITRRKNKNIAVSLFKREGKLLGIVPLTTYNTYQFEIDKISRDSLPHASMQLLEINKLNIRLLITFIYDQKNRFDCFILPDLSNLINLINSNTYKIYGIIENEVLIAVYFFRDSDMYYEKDKEREKDGVKDGEKNGEKKIKAIDCFASINNCHHNEIFLKGFLVALHKYSKKMKAKLLTIENIGDTNIIISKFFLLNLIPRIVSPTAYFYYNYSKKPIAPGKTVIIC
jgi:hypothetical protein